MLLIVNMLLFMLGRFFSTWLMRWYAASRLMGIYGLINICLVLLVILGSEWASWSGIHGVSYWIGIVAMLSTTFFMSLMYPTNFALGVRDLGVHAKLGASLLIMSLIGGALLTPLIGLIAELPFAQSIAPGLVIPMLSYAVISWYGFIGSRLR
jgi:FHS family L-fucose permease-like MFS transporter